MVYFCLCKLDGICGAGYHAKVATFTALSVNDDSTFDFCHNSFLGAFDAHILGVKVVFVIKFKYIVYHRQAFLSWALWIEF